jgi:hypothetical protein
MFHRVRRHLTPSVLIALLALVFAVTGGAFAATGAGAGNGGGRANNNKALSFSAGASKSKGTRGPRGPRGVAGPAGKNGTNGVNGAPGATGPAGPKGETGAVGATGLQGIQGEKGKNGKNGEAGAPGEPGPAGTIHPGNPVGSPEPLPSKATETGAWSITAPVTGNIVVTSVSFPIPLETSLSYEHAFLLKQAGRKKQECEEKTGSEQTECEEERVKEEAACPGTAAEPKAVPGNFCAYTAEPSVLVPFARPVQNSSAGFGNAGTATSGANLVFFNPSTESSVEWGTWAVTAP